MINNKIEKNGILIFRRLDSLKYVLKSIVTLNLDNHICRVQDKNEKCIYLIDENKKEYEISFDELNEFEYYYYENSNENNFLVEQKNYVFGNNIGKHRDKYRFYFLSHFLSMLIDMYFFYYNFAHFNIIFVVAFFKYVTLIFVKLIAMIQANTHNVMEGGMAISGGLCGLYVCKIINNFINNFDHTMMLYKYSKICSIRVFLTRFSSWLINDFPGTWNVKTNRPRDSALYEAIMEGFVTLFFVNYCDFSVFQWGILYMINRFICEYISKPFKLQAYIDTSFVMLVCFYLERKLSISGVLFILLYIDEIIRLNNNLEKKEYKNNNFSLLLELTYNYGFFNGEYNDLNLLIKKTLNIFSVVLFNIIFYYFSSPEIFVLFLTSSCSNLIERLVRGYVTDYIKIDIFNFTINSFNIADLNIIFCFIVLFFNFFY